MLGIYARTFMIAARLDALERERLPMSQVEAHPRGWWRWRPAPQGTRLPDPAPRRL